MVYKSLPVYLNLYLYPFFFADSVFFYVKFNDKKQYPDGDHAINIENLGLKISKWKKILQSLGSGLKKREKLPGWVFE